MKLQNPMLTKNNQGRTGSWASLLETKWLASISASLWCLVTPDFATPTSCQSFQESINTFGTILGECNARTPEARNPWISVPAVFLKPADDAYFDRKEEMKGIGPGGSQVTAEEAASSLSTLEDKILNHYNYAKVLHLSLINLLHIPVQYCYAIGIVNTSLKHVTSESCAGNVCWNSCSSIPAGWWNSMVCFSSCKGKFVHLLGLHVTQLRCCFFLHFPVWLSSLRSSVVHVSLLWEAYTNLMVLCQIFTGHSRCSRGITSSSCIRPCWGWFCFDPPTRGAHFRVDCLSIEPIDLCFVAEKLLHKQSSIWFWLTLGLHRFMQGQSHSWRRW